MSQQHPSAARRRSSLLANPADDASDLIVDWDHRHRASVTYGGEEDDDSGDDDTRNNTGGQHGNANYDATRRQSVAEMTTGQAQTTAVNNSSTSRGSEREALFDRIAALAGHGAIDAAAGTNNLLFDQAASGMDTIDGVASEQLPQAYPPPSAASTETSATANAATSREAATTNDGTTARRTVRFHQHNRILSVEGRHHYTQRETSLTWYDADDAAEMRQTYASDVRTMRRRIRRDVDLHHHTYTVNGGNYSERGLEHLVSTAVYQARTEDQVGGPSRRFWRRRRISMRATTNHQKREVAGRRKMPVPIMMMAVITKAIRTSWPGCTSR